MESQRILQKQNPFVWIVNKNSYQSQIEFSNLPSVLQLILQMINIAIFASGSGSNAESIMEYFKHHSSIKVVAVLANKPDAFVLERAKKYGVDTMVFNKESYKGEDVINFLDQHQVDLIALAGFLWLIPTKYIDKYEILNIHPALLPKYGGKGLYGIHVHTAVKESGDSQSGMTIHKVNQNYDEGDILFQESCDIDASDSPEEIGKKVLKLEHKNYPSVIENYAIKNIKK